MERVLLFSLKNDRIKISIEAFFEESGNLVVEGYDIGKSVEEFWGDSDYEYSITITTDQVTKISTILQLPIGNQSELLSYLRQHYNTNTCYSEFRNWLEQNNITHEGFSWR